MQILDNELEQMHEDLRYKEDNLVIYENAAVYLKILFKDNKRIGLTECCFAHRPCKRHIKYPLTKHFIDKTFITL